MGVIEKDAHHCKANWQLKSTGLLPEQHWGRPVVHTELSEAPSQPVLLGRADGPSLWSLLSQVVKQAPSGPVERGVNFLLAKDSPFLP